MNYEIREDLAMILPLPVTKDSGDYAVQFIDLSGYRELFHDLDKAFPIPLARGSRGPNLKSLGLATKLKVHKVGDFEA